ncbi:MAG: hypothetical protein ACP5NL_02200 [Thermoplasmata archaeon]
MTLSEKTTKRIMIIASLVLIIQIIIVGVIYYAFSRSDYSAFGIALGLEFILTAENLFLFSFFGKR